MGADRIAVLVRCDEMVTPERIGELATAALRILEYREVDTHFGQEWNGRWESWYWRPDTPLMRLGELAEFVAADELQRPHYLLTPDGRVVLWHELDLPSFITAYGDCWVMYAHAY